MNGSASAGVVTQASLNSGTFLNSGGQGNSATAATWTYAWFTIAVVFILAVYFGFGGLRGSVAS